GKGAELGGKGEPWRSEDGSHGVVRSYHPGQQVRISWHADEQAPSTLVELHLLPEGEGTRLSLRYQETPDAGVNENLRQHWSDALGRIVTGLPPVSEPPVEANT
ncbi:MAG: SRPBCC domain-containing protein, partial [Dermatophilaceae bacterium]